MEFQARLADQLTGPAQAMKAAVRDFRTELQAASAQLAAFAAAGGRVGPVAAGGLEQAAAGSKAAAGAASEAAAAGATIRPAWAAGQAQARAATGAFQASGKAASSASAAAGSAGKAAADVGSKAAAAGKAGSSALAMIGSGAGKAGAALGAVKAALPLLGAALGAAGVLGLSKFALGTRGVSQMQAVTARAQLDFRRLFLGIDPSPVVRAYAQFMRLFSVSSSTGQALSGIFQRAFGGLFSAVEKVEPYVTAFAQGMVLAFLYAENGILRARVALAPYTGALEGVVSQSTLLKLAAVGGGLAIAAAGVAAAAAAAPFLAVAAAIGSVAAALEQAIKLSREWDENSGSQIWRKIKSDLGVGSQQDRERAQGIVQGADFDKQQAATTAVAPALEAARKAGSDAAAAGAASRDAAAKGADPAKAAAAGNATGTAMVAGMVQGMNAGQAAVAKAGADLAGAADKGVRDKAQIQSPSKLFHREAQYMAEGAVGGFKDKAGDVGAAAANALVPRLGSGSSSSSAGAAGIVIQSLTVQAPNVFDEGGLAAYVRGELRGGVFEAVESLGAPA